MGYQYDGRTEEEREGWRTAKQSFWMDWLSWTWDRWTVVFLIPPVLIVYLAYVVATKAVHGDDSRKLAFVALCVSALGACAGIGNFVLSRFRIVGVHSIRTTYAATAMDPKKGVHEIQCDVRAYGAPMHDLSVRIEIVIPPSRELVRHKLVSNNYFPLQPVGELRSPLNAGQGQYFTVNDAGRDDRPKGHFFSDEYMTNLLQSAKLKNVSLCVYCAKRRTLLRRIRTRNFHFQLACYFGHKLKVTQPWWQRLWVKYEIWRVERQNALVMKYQKLEGVTDTP